MKIIINSGYFDPLHVGHIECMELSRKLGDKLVIILNNDEQVKLKKGKPFMVEEERKKIVESLRVVDEVLVSIDKDKSVCESIKTIAEKYKGHEIIFAKGGDRFSDEIPEAKVCKEFGIKIVDKIGKKIQSSSWLIKGKKATKSLKFKKELSEMILNENKYITWRLFDDKNLSIGNIIQLIVWGTKEKFAQAKIIKIKETTFGNLTEEDKEGHEKFSSDEEMHETYSRYYQTKVTPETKLKVIKFELLK